jgi:precorrin-2 dehydrogenase / sirohydrochlorin ferrochelatase
MDRAAAHRFAFPISLDVTGRRCLVLGGDFEATDKARKLSRAGARVQIIADRVEPEVERMAEAGEVGWAARGFEIADLKGAYMVFVTPEEGARVEEVARLSRLEGFWLCAIDAPEHGDFANPATFTVGDLVVALSSGGRVPALLRRLREDLEAALDTAPMRAFVEAMASLREQTPRGERSALLRRAAAGFGLEVRVRLPAWFDQGKPGPE